MYDIIKITKFFGRMESSMERKLFNRIGLLVSIGLIVLFVVCSFSFFEHEIILNNNPIALFHEQFLWFMPTLLLLVTFIVPISTKRVNVLIIGALINIIQIIGSGVAIIMLIVLAIKYISAAPGDKADIKKHAVVYVVGAIVLFAASGLLGIIKNFASAVTAAE